MNKPKKLSESGGWRHGGKERKICKDLVANLGTVDA